MLSPQDEPIAPIATAVGSSDQSHFSRIFKRFMRMTRAEYRANFHAHQAEIFLLSYAQADATVILFRKVCTVPFRWARSNLI